MFNDSLNLNDSLTLMMVYATGPLVDTPVLCFTGLTSKIYFVSCGENRWCQISYMHYRMRVNLHCFSLSLI